MQMKFTENQRKFTFFYLIFHLIGYSSFVFDINPFIEVEDGKYYLITPEIRKGVIWVGEYSSDKWRPGGFYPFHKFFPWRTDDVEFYGVWGLYSHMEFIAYVLIPIFIFGLSLIYKRFVNIKNS